MSASSTISNEVALRRMIAESEKLSAGQRKLIAESQKLDRERRLAPWLAWVGLIGGVVTVASVILRAFGVIP